MLIVKSASFNNNTCFLMHNKIIINGNINNEVILMVRKISVVVMLLIILLHSVTSHAEDFKYAEIFDPKQDKVVKVVKVNKKIYNTVTGWIKNVDGIYGKNDPVTDDGYAVRIPLEPPVQIENEWMNALVSEVYILIPEKDPAFFMVFESGSKLSCFPFNGDIKKLSKILDFKLK